MANCEADRTPTLSHITRPLSYAQAVSGEIESGFLLKESPPPRVVRGNIAMMVDEEEYDKGVAEFKFSLIGRLVLLTGDKPIKIDDLKNRSSTISKIKEDAWKLIPLGKWYFNIHITSSGEKSKVFSMGALFLRPGVFMVSEW